jgi:hypothetical protein
MLLGIAFTWEMGIILMLVFVVEALIVAVFSCQFARSSGYIEDAIGIPLLMVTLLLVASNFAAAALSDLFSEFSIDYGGILKASFVLMLLGICESFLGYYSSEKRWI